MTKYQPVIGIEVHVELNTKSKMFCRCSADYFGKEPNTHTCPVCLGLPGALPYINEEAIRKCIQIGLALNCRISEKSLFERKNYFYPDLPKGYQISQYRWPLCVNGQLTLDNGQKIHINRVHQEEDTGKLTHIGGETLIDFNRSGVPLVEIVTEPDFKTSEEVRDYAKKLQQIFRYLGVSNADMERGDMRLEANVSVRKVKSKKEKVKTELPNYRVELKNINSFRFVVAAIEYEIKRQTELLENGKTLTQETRGWNEDKKYTFLQRSKEEAHDYRYFPEPDLPGIFFENKKIDELKNSLSELPQIKIERFEKEYGINKTQARLLMGTRGMAQYFEEAVRIGKSKEISGSQIANYIINRKIDPTASPEQIVDDIAQKTTGIISDETELEKVASEVIEKNPRAVLDYKKGKEAALQVLIGAVMKKTSGKADAQKVKEIFISLLKSAL